jgi:hypothetical protein
MSRTVLRMRRSGHRTGALWPVAGSWSAEAGMREPLVMTERKSGGTRETLRTLAYALAMALVIRTFAFEQGSRFGWRAVCYTNRNADGQCELLLFKYA